MLSETPKADPRVRRNAVWLLAAEIVLGVVVLLGFGDPQPAIETWVTGQLDERGGIGGTLLLPAMVWWLARSSETMA